MKQRQVSIISQVCNNFCVLHLCSGIRCGLDVVPPDCLVVATTFMSKLYICYTWCALRFKSQQGWSWSHISFLSTCDLIDVIDRAMLSPFVQASNVLSYTCHYRHSCNMFGCSTSRLFRTHPFNASRFRERFQRSPKKNVNSSE